MKLRTIFLCALSALSSAALAQSVPACPWLTLGTAEKALGGAATVAVQQSSPPEGSCQFALKGTPHSVLQITVTKAQKHVCSDADAPLVGLGNQARQCVQKSGEGQPMDVIEGRVRDLNYVITMTQPALPSHSAPSKAGLIPTVSAIEVVADIVAGNLY